MNRRHQDSDNTWRVYKAGSLSDASDDGSSILRLWYWLAFFNARDKREKMIEVRDRASATANSRQQ